MKKKINWADICVSLALYGLSAFVFIYSASFKKSMDNSLAPAVWPRIICVLLCIVATIQIINALRGKLTIEANFAHMGRVLIAMALVIAYGLLLKKVGFIVCTVVLLVALLALFDVKKWYVYIILPVVVTGLVFYLFKGLLRVPLPIGILKPLVSVFPFLR